MIFSRSEYLNFKVKEVQGRYVTNEHIDSVISDLNVEIVGHSVQNRPIKSVTIGHGEKRVLMWSQMHGNEATTTKAVLDLLRLLGSKNDFANRILEACSIKIVPILNPDGAHAYSRPNANQVDLNRDAQNRTQPESKVLRTVYDDFEPDYCFNLHDQRTIYNVGTSAKPATVSFLAPAFDEKRSISKTRAISMQLIVAMNEELQEVIPGQIGRYDDAFNANCIGDTFQMLNTPTILFEAGHFHKDYEREKTREFIFYSMVKAIDAIANNDGKNYDHTSYFDIPENCKSFFDVLVRNVPVPNSSKRRDIGILFKEVLHEGKISFVRHIEKEGDLDGFFGHETYDVLNAEDSLYLKGTDFSEFLGI